MMSKSIRASTWGSSAFGNNRALRALLLLATAWSVPTQAQVYDSAAMYSPDSGGLPVTNIALDGYIPVPIVWHYNPVAPASAGNPPLPQLKDRLTYAWQQNHAPYVAGLFVHDSATPLVGGDQRFYLQRTMEWLDYQDYPLHYVFADLEEGPLDNVHSHVLAMLNQVRAYPDPGINTARVGNYNDFPGSYSYYSVWPEPYPAQGANGLIRTSDGDPDDAFYRNSGLDLAMPVAYPFSVGSTHTVDNYWGVGRWTDPATGSASTFSLVAPNQRSAFFWAPLEAVSTAVRNLTDSMSSHEVIPFISMIQTLPNYPVASGQHLTLEDYKAALAHYRLRGVDGFRTFASTVDEEAYGVNYTAYREAMRDTWNSMNEFFAAPAALRIINTGTNCVDGVEWSAAQKGNRVLALISNLTTSPRSLSWDNAIALYTDRTKTRNVRQLPALSPSIPANTHRLLQYRSNYLDYEDMQTFAHGQSMNNQGERSWQGPNADRFVAQAPQGAGNGSPTAVSTASDTPYADQVAWYEAPNPGFADTDQVVYSGYLYNGGAVSGFITANVTNVDGATEPGNDRQGFYVSINWDTFTFRPSRTAGAIHQATNVIGTHDKWFEVRVVVDPTRDIDGTAGGSHGVARIFVRNLATGDKDFTLLVWDDLSTSGTVERKWELPLVLDDSLRKTTLFDGMMVVGNGPNVAVDNLNVGYHAPTLDDNMQHYAAATAMNLQTQPWKGPTQPNGKQSPPKLPGMAQHWPQPLSHAPTTHGGRPSAPTLRPMTWLCIPLKYTDAKALVFHRSIRRAPSTQTGS